MGFAFPSFFELMVAIFSDMPIVFLLILIFELSFIDLQVKVGIYTNGEEVKNLRFSANNTRNTDDKSETWYSSDHIIDSGWSSLTAENPPFYLGWWWINP